MPSPTLDSAVPTALALVVLLLTAGCVGGPTPGTSTASPTSASPTPTPVGSPSPTPDATPTAAPGTDLAGASVTLPDGPKEPPARPPTLNESSVRTYVRTLEYRYAYNALWLNEYTDVTLECEVESVTERPYGYEAVVTCSGYSDSDVPANATVTPGPHADWFTQTYRYRVDEDTTLRIDAEA